MTGHAAGRPERPVGGSRALERCGWCGREVDPGEGYRLGERPGERRAVFCRLEHVVPWVMQRPHWEAGSLQGAAGPGRGDQPLRALRDTARRGGPAPGAPPRRAPDPRWLLLRGPIS